MSNVNKDNDSRTARLQIDRNSASNGQVTTNKFVSSRNKIIARAASANDHRLQQSNPESRHRYNHSSHGSTNQNPHNQPKPVVDPLSIGQGQGGQPNGSRTSSYRGQRRGQEGSRPLRKPAWPKEMKT